MARATNKWQTLTENEILDGQKRILDFYPLGNLPLKRIFPVLNIFNNVKTPAVFDKLDGEDKIKPAVILNNNKLKLTG